MSKLPSWVEDNKFQIVMGLVGLFLIGVGVWQAIDKQMADDSLIEIIESTELESTTEKMVVDVSGAVENPGVYEFDQGARINDVLMAAGGLSAEADRGYVSRGVNLAEKIVDGAKIYIPFKDDPSSLVLGSSVGGSSSVGGKVSINTASVSELDSLWGIGESRAQQIVENRPYSSIDELTSKANIPTNVLETNKDKICL
jgi:competence protein ComEA